MLNYIISVSENKILPKYEGSKAMSELEGLFNSFQEIPCSIKLSYDGVLGSNEKKYMGRRGAKLPRKEINKMLENFNKEQKTVIFYELKDVTNYQNWFAKSI